MLISESYRALNRQLHEDRPDYGCDSFGWSNWAVELIEKNGYKSVLDYGCGKGKLGEKLADKDLTIGEYDPAIPGKDVMPDPAELVVCTDVMEHIEPVHLNAVLRHLRDLTQKRLFMTIFTKPAGKNLPDGRNAHILQKPSAWWREKLLEHFQVLLWEERGATIACELVAKKHTGTRKPQFRRPVNPEMMIYLTTIRDQINVNSDSFSQISTVRMFEGIDDEPADLQGACDILQNLDDIDSALGELAGLSQKCTFLAVRVSDLITEYDWMRVVEKRFRLSRADRASEHLLMVGAPGVMVQGVKAVGAVASDDRWNNIKAATERVQRRIELAGPHDRTALIACYGPSLVDTIDQLKIEAAKPDVDVVSVSGAHDFLIENGIVPKYHVECDPRPHKALNIDKPHPDVTYMVASVCHADYFDKLGNADIQLWHVSTTEHVLRLISELKENPKHVISGGGSVGLRSIPLLYAMGYRDFSVFAMDCSFKDDGERQWAGKHAGKRQDRCEVLCDETVFVSSPVLLTYATNFFEMVQKVNDMNVRLYGDGLLQAMAQYYMRQGVMERVETEEAA